MNLDARTRRIVFGAAILAIMMASVEGTIVATAMPTIVADLGGLKLFAWVFGIYFLTQAVTIPIYGRFADIYGRRRMIFIAIALFLVSSIACGFSRSMTVLILFRALQGFGAGGIQPIASTIVGDIFSPVERAKYQGYMSSSWAASAILGPLLGAFLLTHFPWASIFWVNVPVGLAAVAVLSIFYRERVQHRAHRIDYLGTLLLTLGVGGLMFVLLLGSEQHGAWIVATGALVVLALAALIFHELRTPEPIMPVALWSDRVIVLANLGCFTIGAMVMAVTVFLPTYVERTMGATPLIAGVILGIQSVWWTAASVAGARLMLRTSYRVAAVSGGVILLVGAAMLVLLDPARGPWWAFAGSSITGFGFGLCNIVFMLSVQGAVDQSRRGAATASNVFSRQFGQSIGTALLGAVFNLGMRGRGSLGGGDVGAIAGAVHDVYVVMGVAGFGMLALALGIPPRLSPTRAAQASEPSGSTFSKVGIDRA